MLLAHEELWEYPISKELEVLLKDNLYYDH